MLIVVSSFKGGVGKSTTAVNLACYMAEEGFKTLLVDGDPIRTCLAWHQQGEGLPCDVVDVEEANLQGYEHIVIDTEAHPDPDDWKVLTQKADLVIIPTQPTFASLLAVRKALPTLNTVNYKLLITFSPPPPSRDGEDTISELRRMKLPHFVTPVRRYLAHEKAMSQGVYIRYVKDRYRYNAWLDYRRIAEEVLAHE